MQCLNSGSSATACPPEHESVVSDESLQVFDMYSTFQVKRNLFHIETTTCTTGLYTSFQELSKKITAEWMDIGRELKLTEGDLFHLKKDHHNNQKEAIYQMLVTWRNKEDTAATCVTLREVLRKCNRADLGKHVK